MDRKSLSIGNVQKLALLALLLVICVGSPAQVYNFNYLNSSLRKVLALYLPDKDGKIGRAHV